MLRLSGDVRLSVYIQDAGNYQHELSTASRLHSSVTDSHTTVFVLGRQRLVMSHLVNQQSTETTYRLYDVALMNERFVLLLF